MSAPFVTTREEIWEAVVRRVPHDFVIVNGQYGPGRDYYTLNRDLFDALHRFFDRKERAAAVQPPPEGPQP